MRPCGDILPRWRFPIWFSRCPLSDAEINNVNVDANIMEWQTQYRQTRHRTVHDFRWDRHQEYWHHGACKCDMTKEPYCPSQFSILHVLAPSEKHVPLLTLYFWKHKQNTFHEMKTTLAWHALTRLYQLITVVSSTLNFKNAQRSYLVSSQCGRPSFFFSY